MALKIINAVQTTTTGVLVLILCLLQTACVSPVSKEAVEAKPEVIKSLRRYQKEYVLVPGHQIEVTVYRHPEVSRTVAVRSDGYISLPILDDVLVARKTIREVDYHLTKLLSSRLVDPEVTIILQNVSEPMVYVFGEVSRPQPVPLRDARTAAQAIAQVGGMTRPAAKDSVAVVRLGEDGKLVAHLIEDLDDGQPAIYMALQNMLLQPDDLLIVPESRRSQFVRFVDDYLNTPAKLINQILSPYFQFTLISEISR